jgi:hypothetical protein
MIFTVTVLSPLWASGSASSTDTAHSGNPVCLSSCCTNRSAVDFSKSRTGSTSLTTYAPHGNTSSIDTPYLPLLAS